MRLDFHRYLVPEKIDNLCVILTLIEWSNTPLLVQESWIAFRHSLILVWIPFYSNLSSLRGVFLILNVYQRLAFLYFFNDIRHFACFVKNARIFFLRESANCVHLTNINNNKVCNWYFSVANILILEVGRGGDETRIGRRYLFKRIFLFNLYCWTTYFQCMN